MLRHSSECDQPRTAAATEAGPAMETRYNRPPLRTLNQESYMDINGKTAVITGGASGLGEATVRKLHSMGAKIAIFDLQEDKGKAIAKELGDRVIFQKVNVV